MKIKDWRSEEGLSEWPPEQLEKAAEELAFYNKKMRQLGRPEVTPAEYDVISKKVKADRERKAAEEKAQAEEKRWQEIKTGAAREAERAKEPERAAAKRVDKSSRAYQQGFNRGFRYATEVLTAFNTPFKYRSAQQLYLTGGQSEGGVSEPRARKEAGSGAAKSWADDIQNQANYQAGFMAGVYAVD